MPYKDPARKLAWDHSRPERKRDRHLRKTVERIPSAYRRGAFVAVDGEACYRKEPLDGPQLYTLLAASDGKRATRVWNPDGLSTVECLDFLLSLPERYGRPIVVGFSLTYDVAHWLRDLGPSRWTRLFRYKSVWFGPYNVRYVPRKWLEVWRCAKGGHVHGGGCFRRRNGAAYV